VAFQVAEKQNINQQEVKKVSDELFSPLGVRQKPRSASFEQVIPYFTMKRYQISDASTQSEIDLAIRSCFETFRQTYEGKIVPL